MSNRGVVDIYMFLFMDGMEWEMEEIWFASWVKRKQGRKDDVKKSLSLTYLPHISQLPLWLSTTTTTTTTL